MKRSLVIGLLISIGIGVTAFRYLHKSEKGAKIESFFESEEEEGEEKEGHQTGADKQLQGWFWTKGYPNPENLGQKYEAAWQEYLDIKENTAKLLTTNSTARTTGFGSWASLGNVAGIGGRVVCITIDPNNANNNLFIGTASGGIYKTTNGGTSWTYVPTGKPVLGVGAIVYHPTNSNIILAGTGEAYRVNGSDQGNVGFNVWKCRGTYGIGILRTADGGATWTQVMTKTSSQLFAVQEIMFDPNNANNVYACATDGVYKSTDGGATWGTTPILAKTYVRDIAINPGNSLQMVVSVGNLVNTDKGLYRTTDGGATWSKIMTTPTSYAGYAKLDNNGTRLYAGFANGSGDELWMSSDFGATWYNKASTSYASSQYWFAQDVACDPTNANKLVVGGKSYYTYTSSNATTGGTLSAISTTMHADVHDIEYHPTNGSIVYAANDGGMYKSTDGGATWAAINNGLIAVQFYASFACSPTSPNVMIGGLQDNGVVVYNGTSWSSTLGGDGGPAAFHATDGNRVIYCNDARAVYLSTNAGGTETQKMLNLGYGYAAAHDDRTAFISPVAVSKSMPTRMYAASDNLHISLDSGGSFSRTDPVATGTAGMTRPIDAQYKPAITLGLSPIDNNKLYVSTSPLSQRTDDALNYTPPCKVLRSLNADDNTNYSFTNISGTLPDRMTTDFAISRFSDDSVYITMGGFGTGHVYLTPDGGATWLNRSTGLPDVPFNAVLIDPLRPNVIYAACDFGVYVSQNRGVNWYDFNNGFLENTMVMDLQVTADYKLVAATHGKGAYRTALFVPPVALPVNFQTFIGTHKQAENNLHWTVDNEKNVKQYEVERSTDGVRYQRIGTVNATSRSGVNTYDYDDKNTAGTNELFYYRLKAVDNDAAYFYSDVVILRNEAPHNSFQVLGNPFTDRINLRLQSTTASAVIIRLSDMSGKLLRTEERKAAQGVNNYSIENLSGLGQGFYLVQLQCGKNNFSEKLIKQ